MKKLLILLTITLLFISCNKDDQSKNPIDALPPITTTGENTIGCLVNGEPFTDKGLMNNFYQLVDGEYFFSISWEQGNKGKIKYGQIAIRRIEIEEGETYTLNINSIQNDFTGGNANYTFVNGSDSEEYQTNSNYFGNITFTRFDTENQIMSGTFSFQAEEIKTGEVVNITDGRFDLTFTN